MKKMIVKLCVFAWMLSPYAFSQNWTDEQLEVLESVKTGWTLWSEAVEKKNIDNQDAVFAKDFQGWWTSRGGLSRQIDERRFAIVMSTVKAVDWESIYPLSIRIIDDTALIYFYVRYRVQDHSGVWKSYEEKRLEVKIRQDGLWKWTGGMIVREEL